MDAVQQKFYDEFVQGPVVLFLGQKYLSLESGRDPLLSEVFRKYGALTKNDLHSVNYIDFLSMNFDEQVEDVFSWIQGRCTRLSTPDWLSIVADFAWNSVYTSVFDTTWQPTFRKEWRELQPIFEEKYNPNNPRNQLVLNCTYLYGRTDRIETQERPPINRREYYLRKQVANSLLRRIPDIVTPLGHFVIEGYDGRFDWVSLEDLLSTVVDHLDKGQCHIFSSKTEFFSDSYANELIKEGKLVLHGQSLAQFLLHGHKSGFLQLGLRPEELKHGHKILVNKTILHVPNSVWSRVTRSATILDDLVLLEPKTISADERYREFRNFLSESGTIPLWSGYARGLAFRRDYEENLQKTVVNLLRKHDLIEDPILLSGQTGTGKSIALARIAYLIRQMGENPVLYIESNRKKPRNEDIDYFCQWIKREWEHTQNGNISSILIVWDSNDAENYYSLSRYLAGRGHHVVVVGSCYKIENSQARQKKEIVEADPFLSNDEILRFKDYLNSFEPSLAKQLDNYIRPGDDSFLVALYRLLPPTRYLIQSGVVREFDNTERIIERLSRLGRQEDNDLDLHNTTLFHALARAGILDEEEMLSSTTTKFAQEDVTEIHKLLGFIMVPGSLGLRLPFELLLHALDKDEYSFFSELLSQFDIFHWHQDPIGNITISPRHPLEAMLWTKSNLGGAKYEIEYLKKLLFSINDTGELFDNVEVQFAIDLLKQIGPNNQRNSSRYDYFCKDLADTLSDLRTKRNIVNARLMLQEASFLREYIRIESKDGPPPKNTSEILNKAEQILVNALSLLGQENQSRGYYLGELASILGTRFLHSIREGRKIEEILSLYQKTRDAAYAAWSADPENYIPVDILSWTTREYLGVPKLPDIDYLEAEANILHVFDLAEAKVFGPDHEISFQKRRLEIGKYLGKIELTEDAFDKLKSMGSSVGFYLRARDFIKEIPNDRILSKNEIAQCTDAVSYLQENFENIRNDDRTLYLLFKLWWLSKTGKPMFLQERETIPLSIDQWIYVIRLLENLISINELYSNPRLLFILALAKFHVNELKMSFQIFKELERDTDFRTGRLRIIRSYLASKSDGSPVVFSGDVKWIDQDGKKGGLYVPELREVIDFRPRDFNRPNIRRGDSINEFHIAFNFLGPIADPITFPRILRPDNG